MPIMQPIFAMDIQPKRKKTISRATHVQRPVSSVLFSKGRRIEAFFTEDSKLYITPRQQRLLDRGVAIDSGIKKWDALSSRTVREYRTYRSSRTDALYQKLLARYEALSEDARNASHRFAGQFSMAQLWNMSIVGAILVGMVSMTMIYRFLGPGASADTPADAPQTAVAQTVPDAPAPSAITASAIPAAAATQDPAGSDQQQQQTAFDKKVKDMVKGYPIEDMLPYILDKDQSVAAFMIAIAKQESGWGEHVPLLDEQDCYNYWGYREQRQLLGTGGHTCFNSRKDAVDTVAKRIKTLVEDEGLNTPSKMILWKCGDSCVGDSSEQTWISTVSSVHDELMAH